MIVARRVKTIFLLAAAAFGIAAMTAERLIVPYRKSPDFDAQVAAAALMREAERAVLEARRAAGVPLDPRADPNATGLIGVERSETTTSLGDLEAKRSAANPDMAAVAVSLLVEAGARRGDSIAVGASGSFPSSTLAVLAAAKALGLRVALVASLGASNWGANIPEFSYLAIHKAAEGTLGYRISGVSLGGSDDAGGDMEAEGRSRLRGAIADSGLFFLDSRSAADGAAKRMILYEGFVFPGRYAAFVNVGGASANVGDGPSALELKPGLNRPAAGPGPANRGEKAGRSPEAGVAYEMLARGVPVIHLLNIKRLANDRGMDWDPLPLPPIGSSRVYRVYDRGAYTRGLALLAAAYAAVLAALALGYRRLAAGLR